MSSRSEATPAAPRRRSKAANGSHGSRESRPLACCRAELDLADLAEMPHSLFLRCRFVWLSLQIQEALCRNGTS